MNIAFATHEWLSMPNNANERIVNVKVSTYVQKFEIFRIYMELHGLRRFMHCGMELFH